MVGAILVLTGIFTLLGMLQDTYQESIPVLANEIPESVVESISDEELELNYRDIEAMMLVKSEESSEAEALVEEDKQVTKMLYEAIEDIGDSGSSCGGDDDWSGEDSISDTEQHDTVYTSSGSEYSNDSIDEEGITADSNESEEVSEEESSASSVLEIQEQSTTQNQEELHKKATMAAASHHQARNISKIASHQIKHRIFTRDIVTAAVAAGDEDADDAAEKTHGYSIWSSGTLGSNKQKAKADLNGCSTKIAGGTIGLELNLENNLLVGSSFSKFTSRMKYQDQGGSSDLRNSTASNRTKYDTHIFSLYGSSLVSRDISMSVIGSAGLSKGKKARSKLLSFEPHLNYKLKLPREVKLLPHIGLSYEYEKANAYQEQIASNLSVERSKKSYQALNGEIGSRVIFAPIELNVSTPSTSIISITPTAHFSVERRISSRGKSHPFTFTYYESKQTIGTGTISANSQNARTSLNTGIGLMAGSQNIKLELLYDQQRQKRFKSHQGVLKLKVSL